jgi:hypothetical protein
MRRVLPDSIPGPAGRPGKPSRFATRRGRWVLVAYSILVVGVAVSVAGGLLWRSSVEAHDRQNFQVASTDVSETLETLLNRDADFVTSLRAVLTMRPHLSATSFDEWFSELQGRQRQVGGLGTTVVEAVPAARLAAFQARRDADPAFHALVAGVVDPVARTGRTSYCLLSAGGTVTPYSRAVGQLLQGDWCDPSSPIGSYPVGHGTSQPLLLQSMTDSGQFLVYPVTAQGVSTLFMEAAFYKRGTALTNVAQRRAAVAGWVGSSFQMSVLIRDAIGQHDGLTVALYHSNPGQTEQLVAELAQPAHPMTSAMPPRCRSTAPGERSCADRRAPAPCRQPYRVSDCSSRERHAASCCSL